MANSMVNLVSRLIATGNSFSYKNENIRANYVFLCFVSTVIVVNRNRIEVFKNPKQKPQTFSHIS